MMPRFFGRSESDVFQGDRDLIQLMLEGGEQLGTRPRETTHYMHFQDQAAAEVAATQAAVAGFDVRIEGPEDRDDWQVQASHTILVTEETITDARRMLTPVAEDAGGYYDGWDTYADAALDAHDGDHSAGLSGALDFARYLNAQARDVVSEDGSHEAVFFLELPDGRLQVEQFAFVSDRPVGDRRAKELIEAVKASGASMAAFISEAWAASADSAQAAGDAHDATEVLIVAAADRQGGYVVVETPLTRIGHDRVELGDSVEHEDDGYRVRILDDLRDLWASRPG